MPKPRTPGDRIAQLRETHRLTREALAERSGLPAELLAKIEDGGLVPDLAPLVKIARALGVRLGTFMDDQEELGPVVSRSGQAGPTVRFAGAAAGAAKTDQLDFTSLAAGKGGRHMEPFTIAVLPGAAKAAAASTHEGEEFIFVLEGAVEVLYGKDKYELKAGDSIYYDSIVPHHVGAAGGQPARILAVVYAPF
jgi:transcriptional regulator with XRE-family HTH domain